MAHKNKNVGAEFGHGFAPSRLLKELSHVAGHAQRQLQWLLLLGDDYNCYYYYMHDAPLQRSLLPTPTLLWKNLAMASPRPQLRGKLN